MSGPSPELAGYDYQQRLWVSYYGEIFRALSPYEREVRILHVDRQMAARPGFADALAANRALLQLDHPHVVRTLAVEPLAADQFAVVNEPVTAPSTLRTLMADVAPQRMPEEIAMAISIDVAAGLAEAHRRGVVHGLVHPRSLLVAGDGRAVIADFAAAWALAVTATSAADTDVFKGVRGYIAPELALGDLPNAAADVYAAGALAFELATGEPPPGHVSLPALGRVLMRALASDPLGRYEQAGELEEALREACIADRIGVATADEVASYAVELRSGSEERLDAATEELLAGLPAPAPAPAEVVITAEPPRPDDPRLARIPKVLPKPPRRRRSDSDEWARTPTPLIELKEGNDLPTVSAADPDRLRAMVDDVLAGLEDGAGAEPEQPAPAAPPSSPEPDQSDSHRRRRRSSGTGIWIATTILAVGALVGVLYTQTDLFHPARARARVAAERRHIKAEERRALAAQPKPGAVQVESSPEGAAVWLLLGRTPVDSLELPTGMVHQLRVEHEGYRPRDVDVTPAEWKDKGGKARAAVSVTLRPGTPRRPMLAAPPAPGQGGGGSGGGDAVGHGRIRVSSKPSGAEVYLLVGFTPSARLTGVRAGEKYQFKVLKDGYRPGFVVVRPKMWKKPGTSRPREVVTGKVTLDPLHRR